MKCWEFCAKLFGSYYTLFITIVVCLSMFVSGMSIAWASPMLVKLNDIKDNPLEKPITPEQSDNIGSIIYVGGVLGPFLMMNSVRHFGTKSTIVITNMPCLVGYTILIFSQRIEFLYLARLLTGFTMGGISSVTPAYLSEIIFSVKKRGPYMAISSPVIQFGFLASYAIGPYLSFISFNCFILAISLLATLLLVFCCPEAPNRAIEKKNKNAAINILTKLEVENIEEELEKIESDITDKNDSSFILIFSSVKNLKPFTMATLPLMLQLFSGVAILMVYNEQIFMKSNVNLPSEQCSIIVGIIQVLSASIITITSKKFSRKSLLIFSLCGTTFFDSMLGCYYYFGEKSAQFNWIPLIGLIAFVIFYNSGLDPIPWVYLGEIYPPKIKSIGIASTVALYNIGLYSQTCMFSKVHISFYFFAYAICCLCGIFFVKYKLTETKGRTLREIQNIMIT